MKQFKTLLLSLLVLVGSAATAVAQNRRADQIDSKSFLTDGQE